MFSPRCSGSGPFTLTEDGVCASVCEQEGMQNQVNMNQVNLNQVNMNVETSSSTNQPQFIIQGIPAIQGGVVNLTELLNKANAGTNGW